MGCPAQSHLPGKGEAAQEKRAVKSVCLCVGRQEQVLDSHRCQEGQGAKVRLEQEQAPGGRSQVRLARTCIQMTPKEMISPFPIQRDILKSIRPWIKTTNLAMPHSSLFHNHRKTEFGFNHFSSQGQSLFSPSVPRLSMRLKLCLLQDCPDPAFKGLFLIVFRGCQPCRV